MPVCSVFALNFLSNFQSLDEVLDSAAIKICFAAAEVLREALEFAATEMSQGDSS